MPWIGAPYFSTVLIPMPGIASSAADVAGRLTAIALRTLSVRMRNAGMPRRRASSRRQERSACSIRESGASSDCLVDCLVDCLADRSVLAPGPGCLRFDAVVFFRRLPVEGVADDVSFITKSIGVVSLRA